MAALATATGDPRGSELATSTTLLVTGLTAARQWTVLQRADHHGAEIAYTLAGGTITAQVNPLGSMAAAAAAGAAGHAQDAAGLLREADQQSQRFHTYYGDAWTALGRVLLETDWLSPCPSIPSGT